MYPPVVPLLHICPNNTGGCLAVFYSSVSAGMPAYPDMCYYQSQYQDMSSYIAVQGTPWEDTSQVFGLTPRELRYLKVGIVILTG